MKFYMTLFASLIFIAITFSACKKKSPPPPANAMQMPGFTNKVETPQPEVVIQEMPSQEGYVYEQRGRREPFTSLISSAKTLGEKDESKIGTLEGYDISQFVVTAIVKKGKQYFALFVTPDNKSFTVTEGTIIGSNKGRVKEISGDKVILKEYIKDFKGKPVPKEIILEFHKKE